MAMLEFSTYIQNTSPEGLPAKLAVKIHMFGDWGYGPKGEKLVTPDLISGEEVDHYVNRMIESLKRVRIEAKAKLEENE